MLHISKSELELWNSQTLFISKNQNISCSQKWKQEILEKKKKILVWKYSRIYQHDNYSGDSQTWYFLLQP